MPETKTASAEMELTGAAAGQVMPLGFLLHKLIVFFFQTSIGITDNLKYIFWFYCLKLSALYVLSCGETMHGREVNL